MQLDKLVVTIRKPVHALIRVLTWIASGALAIMMLLVVSNVLTRFLFNKPLLGTIELVEMVVVIVVFFAVAYTEVRRGHVSVELVFLRLPRRTQAILLSIVYFFSAAYFLTMGSRSVGLAWSELFPKIRGTDVLAIPFAPFMFVIALGSLVLGLEMLMNCLHPPLPEADKKGEVN